MLPKFSHSQIKQKAQEYKGNFSAIWEQLTDLQSLQVPTPSNNESTTIEKFKELRKLTFSIRPMLQEIFNIHGEQSIYDYEKSIMRSQPSIVPLERRKQFLDIVKAEVTARLGKDVAESCIAQLEKYFYVSTTLHHGLISHPFITNALLQTSLPTIFEEENDVKNIIVLACSNISFDNKSTSSRGISFQSVTSEGKLQENFVPFFSRKVRPLPLFNAAPYDATAITSAKQSVNQLVTDGVVKQEDADKVITILDEIYLDPQVLACDNFSDQITLSNYNLWKKHIHFGKNPPNLIYLNQERIMLDLLSKYHMHEDTPIHRLIFSPKHHATLEKYFDGIISGFSLANKTGTYLFWALPKGQKYRVQLWRDGNKLTTEDGSYQIELTPDAIKKALDERELMPSTLLSFVTLSFYYGVRLVGGLSQSTYLTHMKAAFTRFQEEVGEKEETMLYRDVATSDLSYWRPLLAFVGNESGEKVPATMIDIAIRGNESFWSKMREQAQKITLGDAINRVIPGVYKTFFPVAKQDEKLLEVTAEDIDKTSGLKDKIESFTILR